MQTMYFVIIRVLKFKKVILLLKACFMILVKRQVTERTIFIHFLKSGLLVIKKNKKIIKNIISIYTLYMSNQKYCYQILFIFWLLHIHFSMLIKVTQHYLVCNKTSTKGMFAS